MDNKFIACLMQKEPGSSTKDVDCQILVIIDQHAAHERMRLEQLTHGKIWAQITYAMPGPGSCLVQVQEVDCFQ